MCGIAGIVNLHSGQAVAESSIRQMLGMIRYRGPDQFGICLDGPAGLGSARLSIIDLKGGQQPICNEDSTLWIVFNGEVFNYLELRPELQARGHRFRTASDTEVLLHLFEEFGPKCLERINGQFAFAIWNAKEQSLFLARDRLGVRPLFYTLQKGDLIFGSEIKTILADPRVHAALDPRVLEQVFTYWCPLSPRTIFHGILEVPPGHYLRAQGVKLEIKSYWDLSFPVSGGSPPEESDRGLGDYEEEFRRLLIDAVRLRLRADVPVGAYLSGGLDSSIIAFIVRNFTNNPLDTFSIAFDHADFDESAWQRQMARSLGTGHQVVQATPADIGRAFPDVIWHTEVPLLRTAPAPMFMLSKRVRDSGYKVVLTGEGSDEFLAGYDIFKEAKIRRFWAHQPDSAWRPLLLKRLYRDLGGLAKNNPAVLGAFFKSDLAEVDAPDYSHAIRWRNGRRNCRFFSQELAHELALQPDSDSIEEQFHPELKRWHPLARAQYLETKIFLSQYLLSSQGDRMGMAHSIEGRFPFLDCRLVEFCNRLPPRLKLRGLTEKYILRKLGEKWLPKEIWQRPKRPYRAPIHPCFFSPAAADYTHDLLSPEKLRASGLFQPAAVNQLVQKIQRGMPISETDDMALAGILSTQLVHLQFISGFRVSPPLSQRDDVKVVEARN